MHGDDVTKVNQSMPWFPDGMPLWQRVLCLLGYHRWERRQTAKGHCYGVQTEEGERKGVFGLHDETPMQLTDQCGRCGALDR